MDYSHILWNYMKKKTIIATKGLNKKLNSENTDILTVIIVGRYTILRN